MMALTTMLRRSRGWVCAVLLCTAVAAIGAAPATAAPQAGSPVTATPPSKGPLTSDGASSRYLLGGSWLYQPDPKRIGVDHGWWHYRLGARGWEPVTMPNSFNAGDLSDASQRGSVGWYRRDFTLPADAFPSYVGKSFQRWVVQFESVNYNATVWLNGHMLGQHAY